ncbi:Sulfate-transp domain-containing protein [Aphelenchoides fujianensis]|nr:Sulfate-transp domain-containing protein [Aphelenchoides fujianensis]
MKRPVEMPVGIEEERTFSRSVYVRHAARNFARPFTSFEAFRRALAGFFPVLPLLADYKWREDFFPDLMSGLTVSSVLVPQSLAYALLAGVQPVNGLVSSFFSTFFYLLFGEVAHVSRGPSSVLGILAQISNDAVQERALARNVTVDPAVAAATLTFTIGIIHVAMAVLHFEFLSSFFSDCLVSGFVSAAAIHTIVSQLPPLFGVHGRHFNGPFGVFAVIALSAASCAFLLVAKLHFSRCFSTPIPYELILIASTTAFSWRFDWRHKMAIVGDVPKGFPAPQMPAFDLLADCFPHALAISAVCLAMHLSMTKVFARQFKWQTE